MVAERECTCIDNIMEAKGDSENLMDVSERYNPEIIKDLALTLKQDIRELEHSCIVPTEAKIQNFFREDRYYRAKEDLDNAIKANGTNIRSAISAGANISDFLLNNASRMVGCRK